MDGATRIQGFSLGVVDLSWKLLGALDYGAGVTELLWEQDGGALSRWITIGGESINGYSPLGSGAVDPTWRMVAPKNAQRISNESHPPIAVAGGNRFGAVNTALVFDGSASSDFLGFVHSYAWDFGDGQMTSGVTASHTYTAAGTYVVKLNVTGASGTAIDTALVEIK
jgi:hypothetical protein